MDTEDLLNALRGLAAIVRDDNGEVRSLAEIAEVTPGVTREQCDALRRIQDHLG